MSCYSCCFIGDSETPTSEQLKLKALLKKKAANQEQSKDKIMMAENQPVLARQAKAGTKTQKG